MSGHERHFRAGQKLFHLFQKLQARHVGHDQIGQNHVSRLLLQQGQGGVSSLGLETDKTEGLADRDAEFTDALLVVHDQQPDAQVFFVRWTVHYTFPRVFDTTSINWCTRNGFSTHGAPVSRRVATVSSLAMSPVMKTTRPARSGRWRAIQAW